MTGRCQDAVPLLGPALDGELAAEDRAWLDEHVAGCAGCTARQQLIAATASGLRQELSARADLVDFSSLAARTMAAVAAARPVPFGERVSLWLRETFGAHRFAFGAGAGLAAAAALAMVVALQPSGRTGEAAPGQVALASADRRSEAEVEELDVYGQEGTVLQLPGQTVIWIEDQGTARRSAE